MGRLGAYFHAALRDEWDGLERINKDLRLADLFTLINALMGMTALFITARTTEPSGLRLAVELVLVGVIMDGVDGAVSRMGKGNGPLGGVLDTLADATTFVVTSAVVAFVSIRMASHPVPDVSRWSEDLGALAITVVPLGFYVVCGLLRLARFESLRDDGKTRHYFSGLPTPAGAMMVLSLVLVGVPAWVLLSVAFYIGILMVSRIRFPKLRGLLAAGTVALLLAVLVTFQNDQLQNSMTWGLLAFMTLYILIGPFYVLARHGARFAGVAK
jgi:CDP-diacylglycerol---serine O-phosphatidyltransferase